MWVGATIFHQNEVICEAEVVTLVDLTTSEEVMVDKVVITEEDMVDKVEVIILKYVS